MKDKLVSLAKRGWVLPVICALVLSITAGVVIAAMTVQFNGSVTVVSGGGGGNPPPLTYTFKVWDAETAGAEVTDTFWALGSINVNNTVNKAVWLENTGTGAVAVTATTDLPATSGTLSGVGAPVNVPVGATRVQLPMTYTAPASAAVQASFTVTFTGNP